MTELPTDKELETWFAKPDSALAMISGTIQAIDFDEKYAKGTLEALHRLWKRPVHIETILQGEGKLLSFDGKSHSESDREVPL